MEFATKKTTSQKQLNQSERSLHVYQLQFRVSIVYTMASTNQKRPEQDIRRHLALIMSIVFLCGSFASWYYGGESASKFASSAMGRIGLVLGALWLAWPSLQRPARWLPAGAPIICLAALLVLAANPRLVVFVLPAAGALIALGMFARNSRGRR